MCVDLSSTLDLLWRNALSTLLTLGRLRWISVDEVTFIYTGMEVISQCCYCRWLENKHNRRQTKRTLQNKFGTNHFIPPSNRTEPKHGCYISKFLVSWQTLIRKKHLFVYVIRTNKMQIVTVILFLSFRRVLNVIYSFLGNSPASEF